MDELPTWVKALILILVVFLAWPVQFAFALLRWGHIAYMAIQHGEDPEEIIRAALTRPEYEDSITS